MKNFYVADAAARADDPKQREFQSAFLVVSKQLKPKKNGSDYLAVVLCDRSGQIEAKMWDNVAQFAGAFEANDVISARGYINRYNGRPQLILQSLARLAPEAVDFSDFLPKTSKDVEQLWAQLGGFVRSIGHPHLRALVQAFLDDPEFAAAFRAAPAAKMLHHACIGGLVEHVVSLMGLCDLACRHYPEVNRDLVLAGAFLHDIGKIHELGYARSFAYTTRGQLLGHMIIELEMVQQKIAGIPGFPEPYKTLLEHMIISHHGQHEFGSPKLPMFPEALLLHYLDDLDSKLENMRAQFERDAGMAGAWTSFNNSLGRALLNSRRYLESGEGPQEASQAEAAGTE
jgi:3'-5' exoribonuclease